MEESQLGGILSRARGLMAMDETINNIANNSREANSKALFESMDEFGGVVDIDESSFAQPTQQQFVPQQVAGGQINSRLPREIIESMTNNPIDTSVLNPNQSILDRVGITAKQQAPKKKSTSVIKEEVVQQTGSQIDYSLIKSIVEECVRKYTGALSKKILKESKENSSELKAMKVGNKFSFITENGDVYEATLKFKKNINEG